MLPVEPHLVADVLGGTAVLHGSIRSLADLDVAVSRGLPRRALDACMARIWPDRRAAERFKFRIVPRATYHRRRLLKVDESERLERLARIVALAEHVWAGDRDAARVFLTSPHPLLDSQVPIEVARSELGARRVEDVLVALLYGHPS
jgi:putative toxin-antitoxin system antitoxin component (TIGR02293 family)